jgi:putative DNA primase/helicase
MVAESPDQASARAARQDSEIDLAMAYANEYAEDWLHDHSRHLWYGFDPTSGNWQPDQTERLLRAIQKFIHDRTTETRLRKSSTVLAVERLCRANEAFATTADQLDVDPFVLGTPAGPYDLTTGRRLEADPEMRITQATSIAPDFDLPERWLQFLAETTGHDLEMITYLQRLCGYCLTGSTREEQITFIHGPGGNGKGVFLGIIKDVIGSYGETTSTDTFLETRGDRNENDLAVLAGKRVAIAQEAQEGRKWDSQRVKSCTGRDAVRAKFLYRDLFTYVPQFKLLVASNHKPRIGSVDDAWRRRMHLVPFERKPARPDPLLKERLRDEYPRILGWMIEGAMLWAKDGLMVPASVTAASEAYLRDEDIVLMWFDERCIIEATTEIARKDLYENFTSWCREMGHGAPTVYHLTRWLKANKGVDQNMQRGARPYVGVRLRDPYSEGGDMPTDASTTSRAGNWPPISQEDDDDLPL